eukprot:gnl/Dysnectes_brevis/868_a961_1742.p1 GENE.gnl/Dysnectes_brevis/868_a961_1742~~gnl/Dysnectes_brevis/868_a961_1742.p1  ORF type:complete len:1128 (-),score=352.46 gnl/Dysnectes_brevis/868_a961_1742:86-3391(-)
MIEHWDRNSVDVGFTFPEPGKSLVVGVKHPQWFDDVKDHTIASLYAKRVNDTPDQECIVFADEDGLSYTYAELHSKIQAVASGLLSLGIKPGATIAAAIPNSSYAVIAIMGVLCSPYRLILINPNYGKRETRGSLEACKAAALITLTEFKGKPLAANACELVSEVEELKHMKVIPVTPPTPIPGQTCTLQELMDKPRHPEFDSIMSRVSPDDIVVFSFTSGSTGRPKMVELSHQCIIRAVLNNRVSVGSLAPPLTPEGNPMSTLVPLPTYFTAATIRLTVSSLIFPRRAVMLSLPFRPARVLEACVLYDVQILTGVPSIFHGIVSNPSLLDIARKTPVFAIFISGAPVTPELVAACRRAFPVAIVRTGFVQTETGGGAVTTTHWRTPESQLLGMAGFCCPNWEMRIQDDEGTILPLGETGELVVRGPGSFLGYHGRPQLTQEAIDSEGWRKTGDCGVINEEGNLKINGRKKNMAIISGQNVYVAEIEAFVDMHPTVARSAVIGYPDRALGEVLIAFVQATAGCEAPTTLEARAFLEKELGLADFKMPRHVFAIKAHQWPRTGSGKLSKPGLRLMAPELVRNSRLSLVAVNPPTSELGLKVADSFAAVLEGLPASAVGSDDSFFDLGGDSIRVIQLQQELLDRGVSLDIVKRAFTFDHFFRSPTIRTVEAVASGDAAAAAADIPEQWIKDATLGAELEALIDGRKDTPAGREIFLTGATGFLGAFLLHALLTRWDRPVRCLVRAVSDQEAQDKVHAAIARSGLSLSDEQKGRVLTVVGDLGRDRFGLSVSAFRAVAGRVGAVIHSGAQVHWFKPYADLAPINVGGTRAAITLAAMSSSPLGFVSSIGGVTSAFTRGQGRRQDGKIIGELTPDLIPRPRLGYSCTKTVAESLINNAVSRGQPAVVFRPGYILGSTETGVSMVDDVVIRCLVGSARVGLRPNWNSGLPGEGLPASPVDWTAQLIAAATLAPAHAFPNGQALHLCDTEFLTWDALFDGMVSHGVEMKACEHVEWLDAIKAAPKSNLAQPILHSFAKDRWVGKAAPSFEREATDAFLKQQGVVTPNVSVEFTPDVCQRYAKYLDESGALSGQTCGDRTFLFRTSAK